MLVSIGTAPVSIDEPLDGALLTGGYYLQCYSRHGEDQPIISMWFGAVTLMVRIRNGRQFARRFTFSFNGLSAGVRNICYGYRYNRVDYR